MAYRRLTGRPGDRPLKLRLLLVFCASAFAWQTLMADELGRLFFTPEQRAALERARYQIPALETPVETSGLEFPIIPLSDVAESEVINRTPLNVNGYVSRSGGDSTVWINGLDSWQDNLGELGIDASKLKLEQSQVRLPLISRPRGVLVKPGQSYDPMSEQTVDGYLLEPPIDDGQ